MSQLVIPDPDKLGVRVTPATPLGHLVGRLRRLNPHAPYAHLKAAAEDLRRRKPKLAQEPPAEPVAAPEVKPKRTPRKRQPKNEAEASMVPVKGGEPIPAEPPARW